MWLTVPVTYPLGWLLDTTLGHDDSLFKRRELAAMVTLHQEGAGMGGTLSADEVNVISGALELTAKVLVLFVGLFVFCLCVCACGGGGGAAGSFLPFDANTHTSQKTHQTNQQKTNKKTKQQQQLKTSKNKAAGAGMTPIDHVFMLSTDDVIDEKMVDRILTQGHSRLPVFRCGRC